MTFREARLADAPAIAEVHVASWRTTYQGLLPDDLLAGLSVDARTEQWRRQLEGSAASGETVLYVAEGLPDAGSDSRIVGFASAGPQRDGDLDFDAELYAIYLLAEHQGGGVGRELMRLAASFLRQKGFKSMLVWVLAGNPAERFYQRMGGERIGEKAITIGGAEYHEVAYGWRSFERVQGT